MATDNGPRLDLESYTANYKGRLLVNRLLAIGSVETHLAQESLHLALREAKKLHNVEGYTKVVMQLAAVAPQDPLAAIDTSWVTATTRKLAAEKERLEAELKQYKNNLIRESIRMGNEDLGNHYLAMGDTTNAERCYFRMRENCTTSKHVVEMNLKLINAAIAKESWILAEGYGKRIASLGIVSEDYAAKYDPIIHATSGLGEFNNGHYKEAADHFLAVNPSYMSLEQTAGIDFQKEVISPNDIATYGGLCALATMDSAALKTRVLENQPFRQFLELESHLRRAISMFCSSKFSACLAVLDSYTADYKLDLYLQAHFEKLYQRIRRKSMIQWLSSFSRVTFKEIQSAFPPPARSVADAEKTPYVFLNELEDLVKSGALEARIDIADQVLVLPTPDPRLAVITKALEMAKLQERALRLKLHRINMLSAGMDVKAPKTMYSSTFGRPMASNSQPVDDGHRSPEPLAAGSSYMV